MTAVLVVTMVACFGTWIPLSQSKHSLTQPERILYVATGNLAVAAVALGIGSSHLTLGWRALWLPLAGGLAWTAGAFSAFRATELTGLARAAGTWAPLNIVTAFVLGILLFGELDHSSTFQLLALASALVLVVIGVLAIVRSQGSEPGTTTGTTEGFATGTTRLRSSGLAWAVAAGLLWGAYFVPAQWAGVTAEAGNLPLAVGILLGAIVVANKGSIAGLRQRSAADAATLLGAGVLFGIGDVTLLVVVQRLGTGVGFTLAQLSLVVNAAIGIWLLKNPAPGSRAARIALGGILLAGSGGLMIGWLR